MPTILFTLLVIAVLCVFAVLIWGLVTMGKGGDVDNARKSNQLMQWRIYLQGVALAIFAVVLLLAQN